MVVAVAAACAVGAAAHWLRASPPQDPAAVPASAVPPSTGASAQVVGRVEMAAGTTPAAQAGQVVVVYAYALDGPRQPLAVLRRPASDLPFDFKLDDRLAPNAAFRLSMAPRLVVGARLGPGDAAAGQPGDWIAPSQTVMLGEHGVRLQLQPPRAP